MSSEQDKDLVAKKNACCMQSTRSTRSGELWAALDSGQGLGTSLLAVTRELDPRNRERHSWPWLRNWIPGTSNWSEPQPAGLTSNRPAWLEGTARQVYLYSTFHTLCKFKVLYIKGSQAGGLTSETAGGHERAAARELDWRVASGLGIATADGLDRWTVSKLDWGSTGRLEWSAAGVLERAAVGGLNFVAASELNWRAASGLASARGDPAELPLEISAG